MPQPPFDSDQLQAVEVEKNAVVAAGAGSGKTTVLAGRYLRLVRGGISIPSILTLTFTRKAAAEMYSRIHRLLVEQAEDPEVMKQLSLFDQAQISTLDSFCARLTRNDAARFGLPSSFAVDQEELGRRAEAFALDFILKHHRNSALKYLIQANGFDTVWHDFFAAYASRELLLTREPDHAEQFAAQERHCRDALQEIFSRLENLYGQMGRVAAAASGKSATLTNAAKAAADWPDTEELIAEEAWESLNSLAGTKPYRKPASNTANPDLILLRDIHDQISELGEQAGSYTAVLSQRDVYAGIMQLMDEFSAGWLTLKRRLGIVSFGDIVSMAVTLLKENLELRKFYKEQFSHIMIDEFQDNNREQKELLYLLAESESRLCRGIPDPESLDPEKLFFVGDEKQSIYRFRGADVRVFKQLSGDLGGAPIELTTNYRSDPGLIEFFNRFFPGVFTAGEKSSDFEAEFRPLKSRTPEPGSPAPEIRLHLLNQPEVSADDELGAADSEAFEAARLISEAVAGKGLALKRDEGTTAPDYKDFALLLRTTGNQIIYERIFRRFEIPYTTENIRTLFLEAPSNDIYAALQLALYPEDRTAYAVFLRSFFVNLEDEYLLQELLSENGPFCGKADNLPEEEQRKYTTGRDIYRTLQQMIDRVPHRDLLRYLWYDAGYRYNLLKDPAYHGYLEFYDYLTALADKSWDAGESAALFIDFLRENLGDYRKLDEIETLTGKTGGVRIMTIHKSKGLEFPIVLLGSTGQGSTSMDKRAPYYLDETYGLTLNLSRTETGGRKTRPNPFYEKNREEADMQEIAELKRLLYVACTRAEQHLIMLGADPARKSSRIPSFLDLIRTGLGVGTEDDRKVVHFPPATRQMLLHKGRKTGKSGIPDYLSYLGTEDYITAPSRSAVSVSRINSLAAEQFFVEKAEILPSWPVDELIRNKEDHFGTMVHRALELHIQGIEEKSPQKLFLDLFSETAPADRERLAEFALTLAEQFWQSETRRRIIPDGVPVYTEAPFTLGLEVNAKEKSDEGLIIQAVDGVIDLYADFGNRIVCLDFKTNRHLQPGEYAIQMFLYRRALEALHKSPAESYLVYLRDGTVRNSSVEFDQESIDSIFSKLRRAEYLSD